MTILSRICSAVLISLIVLTAHSAASARAMTDPSGQMVICTGAGPVVVYVDENGDPVSAPHICPDCALALIAAVDAPAAYQVAFFGEGRLTATPLQSLHQPCLRHRPTARGPPELV